MSIAVAEVLDSGSLRVCGYLFASAVATFRYVAELRRPRPRPIASWPSYWVLSALVLLFLAVSRATSLGDLIAELGREQARSEGWYDHGRRTVQTLAVVAVVSVWLVGVVLAVWRVPPRRRRYLPSVVTISSLIVFALVRVVSLHHIDAVLYRRGIGDVRFVALIELVLLAVTIVSILVVPPLIAQGPSEGAVVDPAVVDPAVVDPAVVDPAVVDPAVEVRACSADE